MMKKIEHLGIAVRDIDASNEVFSKLLGEPHYKIEEVESEGVKTSFFKVGDNKIELLEATNENSPIAKFIERKGGRGGFTTLLLRWMTYTKKLNV